MSEDNFNVTGEPPVEPGVSPAFQIQKEGIVKPAKSKFSPSTKLADIQKDYAFFHPGLLYAELPLERGHDPFSDFCAQKNNSSIRPTTFAVGERFIQGWPKDTDAWASILFVLEKQIFQEYLSFIASTAFIERRENEVWFVSPQQLTIKDPSSSSPTWKDKKIDVVFLGLETNKRTWYFEALAGNSSQVRLIHTMRPDKISEEVRNASRIILGNDIRV